MTAIKTDGLTKRYDDHDAVSDLDLSVPSESIYGLVGPNGAGKSTTLELLCGFISPTAGSARVLGFDPFTEGAQLRAQCGILLTDSALYPRLSAREHVRSALSIRNGTEDPSHLCERVGLSEETASRHVGGFSTGQRQRTKLAIALAGSPSVLVFDEPTSGLDPDGTQLFCRVVREEHNSGTTVLLSSHRLVLLRSICTHAAVIRRGSIVREGSPDTIERVRRGTPIEAPSEPVGAAWGES